MFYYAMIDDSNIVTTTLQAGSEISSPNMIPITEEQYNANNLIGKYYNASTGEFVEPTPDVLADYSTEQINHGKEWLSDYLNNLRGIDVKAFRPNKQPANWTALNTGTTTAKFNSIAYNGENYVAVGKEGIILVSDDLETWQTVSTNITSEMYMLCTFGTAFICTTGSSLVLSTDNGSTWSSVAIPNSESVDGIIECDGALYIGASNHLYDFTDLTSLVEVGTGLENVCAVFSIGDTLYAFGAKLYTSTDGGTTWTGTDYIYSSAEGTSTFNPPYCVIYDGTQFIGCRDSLYISSDGITWSSLSDIIPEGSSCPYHSYSMKKLEGLYLTSGNFGKLWYSFDLINWSITYPCTTNTCDIIYLDDLEKFVVCGWDGEIKTADFKKVMTAYEAIDYLLNLAAASTTN